MDQVKYQTLGEFLLSPFGTYGDMEKSTKYASRYLHFLSTNKIRIEGYTEQDKAYYIHVKVPSESQSNVTYDVIIKFFSSDPMVTSKPSLSGYFIQFFSNSPGFMYKYAVLYKMRGYLIENLYNKMDPDFIDKLPAKSNAQFDMSYDSTIYFACRFLSEHKFVALNKFGILMQRKKTPDRFFGDVSSFKDMKDKQSLLNDEKKETKKVLSSPNAKRREADKHVKGAAISTRKTNNGISIAVKKTGSNSRVPKKSGRQSTRKV